MKHLTLLFLTALIMSQSIADETATRPNERLQVIIDLFLDDLPAQGLALLESDESQIVEEIEETKNAEVYILLGRAYFYAEQDIKSIDAFEAALRIDPEQSDAHFFIGLIQRFSDDLDSAERSFQNAITINSVDQKYFMELARTLEMKGDLTSAAKTYKNVLVLDADNFDANFNLATIHANDGDTETAEIYYLKATEIEPLDADSHYNLGQLYQNTCLLYTSPSPRDLSTSRMPSSA